MELGHFENWSMNTISKKLLNLHNVGKYSQFTIGFSIVKYPDFYVFRRFSSFFLIGHTKMDRSRPLLRVVGAVATLCHSHIPTKRPETACVDRTASQRCVNGVPLKLHGYGWIYR